MKKILALIAFSGIIATGCLKVEVDDSVTNTGDTVLGDTTNPATPCENLQCKLLRSRTLEGSINENVSLPKGTYWLKGYVYVNNRATLTFAPGSIIKSDSISKGALIIERNAKLYAEGTATEPIVFTTGKSVSTRKPGDWGGIVLLGNAPTNRTTEPVIEGGINANYGGNIANDNSGSLKFVRIEFAGIAADPGSEINGLTLGGVGRGTTLENIQVSYGLSLIHI